MAIHVGIGVSTENNEGLAVKDAISQAVFNINRKRIDLAIVFTSINFAYPNLLKTIASYLGNVPIIGCSGTAILSDKGITKSGIVIMVMGLPQDVYFNTACVKEIKTKTPLNAGEEFGDKLLYGFHDLHRDLSIFFSDGLTEEGSDFISGLQRKLGKSFPLIGGCASDNLTFKKTYVYFNQEVLNDSACGIVLGGKLNFGIGVKHGWKPLGKPHRITQSYANVVYKIDEQPAVKLYEDYLASDLTNLKKELKHISVLYPIGIFLPGEEEYLLRNLLSIQNDGSLVLQGNVSQDAEIRLMIGTKESCLSATQQALEDVKKGLMGRESNFLLVFDSASRYILLGREAEKELKIIKETLGKNTQVIGIYTYGEQAPLKAISYQGQTYFHNQTITLVAIGG